MGQLKHYNNFKKGWNNTSAPDDLHDSELMLGDNIDLSERGGFSTRKGTDKINNNSFGYEVEQTFEWFVEGVSRTIAVINNTLCEINSDGTKVEKQAVNSTKVAYLIIQKNLCFMDGNDIYKWDHSTDTIAVITPNSETDNDLTPIKKCTMFVQHPTSLRIFAAGNPDDPLSLYYSEPNDITYFKSSSKLYPTNSEGEITGLSAVLEDVLVSYNNSWWHFKGTTPPNDAIWKRLPIPYGCIANDSIALTPFSFTFLSQEGLFKVNASIINQDLVLVQGNEMIKNIAENKVENTIKDIKNPKNVCAIFHENKYYLAYSDEEGNDRNNKVLAYDWDNKSFVRYTGWQVNYWDKRSTGELRFASKDYILTTDKGYKDFDINTGSFKPIKLVVETKNYDLGNPISSKYLQFLYLQFKQYLTTESNLKISIIADYKSIIINSKLSESLVWNRVWGNNWGFKDLIEKVSEIKEIATRFKIRFENDSIDDPITIYGVGFEFKSLRPRANMISRDEGRLLE